MRGPDGCPWDREQTHHSIRKNFIEETYEVVEAIDTQDISLLKEELGDVLLQVVFHTQMEKESGTFDFDGVCDGICKKLIRRHPHVFADTVVHSSGQVLENWDEIKKAEKQQQTATQSLHSVPRVFPALMRSEKVQKRAAKTGFDYPDLHWAMRDLRSEVDELAQAIASGNASEQEEELGDVFFSAVNVARFLSCDAEESLTKSCDKFIARFTRVEAIAREKNIDMQSADINLLNTLWQEAKYKID